MPFHVFLWGIAPYSNKIYIYHESRYCLRTAARYGLSPEIIGFGYDRPDRPKSVQSQSRFYALEERLKTVSDDDVVLVMDGFDTLFCGTAHEIVSTFQSFNTKVLFSAEKSFTYQWADYQANYETHPSPYRYLGAGTYIGYAHAIRHLTEECIRMAGTRRFCDGFEMGIMGAYLHENYFRQETYRLDNGCDLFWVTTLDPPVEVQGNRLLNPFTNTNPLILHYVDGHRHKKAEYIRCFHQIMSSPQP